MKGFCLTALLLLGSIAAFAIEKSQTVVVIDGAKYYIHTVQAGETLYALAKTYGVGETIIAENNQEIASGIKTNQRLKIPFVAEMPGQLSPRQLRKMFDMHTVVQGETLYAISRRYSIPIQTIIEDNSNLDPIHLRLDEQILIRRDQRGTEPASQVQQQWEQYRDNLNSIADQGAAYHLVQPGETFYSLARRYRISEAQLSQLNGGLQAVDLKAGAIIKVPDVPREAITDHPLQTQTPTLDASEPSASLTDTTRLVRESDFTSLDPRATLRVALLLPLSVDDSAANTGFLEFYQGFLMGLDSVKRSGRSVHLDLFNTGRSVARMEQIVADDAFRDIDLIIGPVYEEMLPPVLRFAERENIPVVSPLAHLTHVQSDVLFQLSSDPGRKYDKVANLIDGSRALTLIYSESTDREFEAEIKEMLGSSQYTKYKFLYNASLRDKVGSASDLTPLLQNNQDNVFIIMADNEIDVDRILAALASANSNLIARGFSIPRFVVLGNNRWHRYTNIDRTMFFKNRIIFLSTYHAKRDSQKITRFDSNYIRAFGTIPSLYSYRGYDTALLFCSAMFREDIRYDLEGVDYTPLQTTYTFGPGIQTPNHVNRNWTRVNYNSNFTITIE